MTTRKPHEHPAAKQLRDIKTRDDALAFARENYGDIITYGEPEPIHVPSSVSTTPEVLAKELAEYIRDYVRNLSDAHVIILVLFGFHTHAFDAANASPRIRLDGPIQSGKTHTMEVLSKIVANSEGVSVNDTDSALYRTIDAVRAETNGKPTLFLDEIELRINDGIIRSDPITRGLVQVLNKGYERGGFVRRTMPDYSVKKYDIFCPTVYAGIGSLHIPALESRSIVIYMTAKDANDDVDFPSDEAYERANRLRKRLSKWAHEHTSQLRTCRPESPNGLDNRQRQIWRPLFAIADSISSEWGTQARKAALELCGIEQDDESITPADDFDAGIRNAIERKFIEPHSYRNRPRGRKPAWISLWRYNGSVELRMAKKDWAQFYQKIVRANPGANYPDARRVLRNYRDMKRLRASGQNLSSTLSIWHGQAQSACVAIDVTEMFNGLPDEGNDDATT